MRKGYMTKYALTQGIQKVEIDEEYGSGSEYVYTRPEKYVRIQLKVGKDFFEDKKAAEREAKKMARKRVESLKKSLKKMQELVKNPKWAD